MHVLRLRTGPATPGGRRRPRIRLAAGVDKSACTKNGLRNFFFANQTFMVKFVRLRTILSTKNVQKISEEPAV